MCDYQQMALHFLSNFARYDMEAVDVLVIEPAVWWAHEVLILNVDEVLSVSDGLYVSLGYGGVDDPSLFWVHVHFRSRSVVKNCRVWGDWPEKLTVPGAPHGSICHMDIYWGLWTVQGWEAHIGLPLLLPPFMEVQVHIVCNGALTLKENLL